jgi:hypothetical protein
MIGTCSDANCGSDMRASYRRKAADCYRLFGRGVDRRDLVARRASVRMSARRHSAPGLSVSAVRSGAPLPDPYSASLPSVTFESRGKR